MNTGGGGIAGMLGTVDKTADVYAAQPEKLQQKVAKGGGVTDDLLNALALQKVVSDQQAAKNQLTLSQQQKPGTIAEQLEMQAQKGSQDRTQAVMGVYNQNKANQDKGARNLAKKEASKATGLANLLGGQQRPPQQQQQRPQQRPQQPQGAGIAGARPPMAMAQGGIVPRYNRGDKVKNRDYRTEEVKLAESHIANIKKLAAAGKLTQEVMQMAYTISKNNPDLLAYLKKEYNFIDSNEMRDIDRQIAAQESEGQNKLPTELPPKTSSRMQADADTSAFLGKLARASAGTPKFNPEGLSGSDLTRMSDEEMGISPPQDVSPNTPEVWTTQNKRLFGSPLLSLLKNTVGGGAKTPKSSPEESKGENKLPTELPPNIPSKTQSSANTDSFLEKIRQVNAGTSNSEGLSGSDLTRMSDEELDLPGLRDVSPEEVSTYRKTGDYKGSDFSIDPNDNRITRQKMSDPAIENRLAARNVSDAGDIARAGIGARPKGTTPGQFRRDTQDKVTEELRSRGAFTPTAGIAAGATPPVKDVPVTPTGIAAGNGGGATVDTPPAGGGLRDQIIAAGKPGITAGTLSKETPLADKFNTEYGLSAIAKQNPKTARDDMARYANETLGLGTYDEAGKYTPNKTARQKGKEDLATLDFEQTQSPAALKRQRRERQSAVMGALAKGGFWTGAGGRALRDYDKNLRADLRRRFVDGMNLGIADETATRAQKKVVLDMAFKGMQEANDSKFAAMDALAKMTEIDMQNNRAAVTRELEAKRANNTALNTSLATLAKMDADAVANEISAQKNEADKRKMATEKLLELEKHRKTVRDEVAEPYAAQLATLIMAANEGDPNAEAELAALKIQIERDTSVVLGPALAGLEVVLTQAAGIPPELLEAAEDAITGGNEVDTSSATADEQEALDLYGIK